MSNEGLRDYDIRMTDSIIEAANGLQDPEVTSQVEDTNKAVVEASAVIDEKARYILFREIIVDNLTGRAEMLGLQDADLIKVFKTDLNQYLTSTGREQVLKIYQKSLDGNSNFVNDELFRIFLKFVKRSKIDFNITINSGSTDGASLVTPISADSQSKLQLDSATLSTLGFRSADLPKELGGRAKNAFPMRDKSRWDSDKAA